MLAPLRKRFAVTPTLPQSAPRMLGTQLWVNLPADTRDCTLHTSRGQSQNADPRTLSNLEGESLTITPNRAAKSRDYRLN